jgi:hypothetical protein
LDAFCIALGMISIHQTIVYWSTGALIYGSIVLQNQQVAMALEQTGRRTHRAWCLAVHGSTTTRA